MTDEEKMTRDLRFAYTGYKFSPKTREKMSHSKCKAYTEGTFNPCTHSISGEYFSLKAGRVWYRSALELVWFEEFDMDDSIIRYFVEPLSIPYQQKDGSIHRYVPDALLETKTDWKLVEIKPDAFLLDETNLLKFTAGEAFALSRNWMWEVLT